MVRLVGNIEIPHAGSLFRPTQMLKGVGAVLPAVEVDAKWRSSVKEPMVTLHTRVSWDDLELFDAGNRGHA